VSNVTVFIFNKTPFLTKSLLLQANDFTDLKCVYSIYISWILNPTFFRPILLTSTKLATKRFIKLFVEANKSIFQANHLFCYRH